MLVWVCIVGACWVARYSTEARLRRPTHELRLVPVPPLATAFHVRGQLPISELCQVPIVGERVSLVMTDVGPAGPLLVERQAMQLVEVVLEGIQRCPLGAGEAGQEQPVRVSGGRNQHGVNVVPESGDAPTLGCGRCARRYAVEEGAQDVREAQASVDEQRRRLPR